MEVKTGKGLTLSKRLSAVASMVEKGSVVCDIGCDHGYLSIDLVENGICKRVIATDINKGPLTAARKHIKERGLEDYIETRLSDGLAALSKDEADTLVCAGMGGPLIQSILEAGKAVAESMNTLILQPQSGLRELREYLRMREYEIIAEDMVFEDGKYYFAIKAAPQEKERAVVPCRADGMEKKAAAAPRKDCAASEIQRVEDRYGPCLLRDRHPVLLRFLTREKDVVAKNLRRLTACAGPGERREAQKRELRERLNDIRYALSLYEKEDCL